MSEAETSISWLAQCAAAVARDWEPLQDGVLRVISRVGGKTEPGLQIINWCLRGGLLELGLTLDGITMRQFTTADCEQRTVYAPLIRPAEGVGVAPYAAGVYLIRRAPDFAAPTSAVDPAPPTEPKHSVLAPSSPQVASESPAEAVEQQKLSRLPKEPQDEPRKWQPNEAKPWLENAKTDHPQKEGEGKSAYARRLYNHMKNDFRENIPWGDWGTLRRRLNDKVIVDDD